MDVEIYPLEDDPIGMRVDCWFFERRRGIWNQRINDHTSVELPIMTSSILDTLYEAIQKKETYGDQDTS